MTTIQKITFYILTTLVSLVFIMGAIPKITAQPMSVDGFAQAHLPLWFMYCIGFAELAGAIGIWIPKVQRWALAGLGIIMIGAIVVTALFQNLLYSIVPLLFIVLLATLYKLGRKKTATLPTI